MPPKKAKQPASNRSSTDATAPKPPETQVQTSRENSPQRQGVAIGITQAQKQQLVDNLQLEVTERARKLRAQYAEHASSLKVRLELRLNLVSQALRKRKIGDLLDECEEKKKPIEPPAPQAISVQRGAEEEQAGKIVRGVKRSSDQMSGDDTQEMTGTHAITAVEAHQQDLANPKKRAKTTTTKTTTVSMVQQANTKASRSKNPLAGPASTVLSPKSHNSRTLPRSPFKAGGSPEKPSIQLLRPTSPAKPAATGRARTASRQQIAKKLAAPADIETERSSGVSDSSAGTTIMRKPTAKGRVPAAKKPATATKATVSAAAKKTTAAAARKENVAPAAAAGGRSLRSKRT